MLEVCSRCGWTIKTHISGALYNVSLVAHCHASPAPSIKAASPRSAPRRRMSPCLDSKPCWRAHAMHTCSHQRQIMPPKQATALGEERSICRLMNRPKQVRKSLGSMPQKYETSLTGHRSHHPRRCSTTLVRSRGLQPWKPSLPSRRHRRKRRHRLHQDRC
jgi:hypothetical protein